MIKIEYYIANNQYYNTLQYITIQYITSYYKFNRMNNSNVTVDEANSPIDLNDIAKSFRNIENSIAKYIYKKYIMPKPININNTVTQNNEDNIVDNIVENTSENEDEDAYVSEEDKDEDVSVSEAANVEELTNEDKSKSIILDNQIKIQDTINIKLYKLYLQKIFDLERHSFRILQHDVLKDDLKNIAIADKAYNINPTNFNPKDYKSLPDVLRCTYIRKHKHRYYRCQHKIINDDNDICKKHENCENIYIDKYNELLEQYQNN